MTREEIIKQITELTGIEPLTRNGSPIFYLSDEEVTIEVRETDIVIGIDRDFCGFYTDLSIYNHDSIRSFAIDIDTDEDNWKWICLTINTTNGIRYIAI